MKVQELIEELQAQHSCDEEVVLYCQAGATSEITVWRDNSKGIVYLS